MGILKKIKEKVVSTVKKVVTAVKGAVTKAAATPVAKAKATAEKKTGVKQIGEPVLKPAEQAEKEARAGKKTVGDTLREAAKRAIYDIPIIGKKYGEPMVPEGMKLYAGTLPITPAGGGAMILGKTGAYVRGATATKGVGILQSIKNLKYFKTAAKLVKGAVIGGVGYSGIATWFAADNIASTSEYYTNLAYNRYMAGEVTRDEALAMMDRLETNMAESKRFININTIVNPILWPFRKFFMTGLEGKESNIEENRRLIETTTETTKEYFARTADEKQEEFLLNQQLILDAQLAAEVRFAAAQEERDTEKKDWAKEQAQFFEALRKRNAGIPLTDEEIQLLLSWGILPEASMVEWDNYGLSNLNFGLI